MHKSPIVPTGVVAVTGMAVATPFGDSLAGVARALGTGQCAIKTYPASRYRVKTEQAERVVTMALLPEREEAYRSKPDKPLFDGGQLGERERYAVALARRALAAATVGVSRCGIVARPDRISIVVSGSVPSSEDLPYRTRFGVARESPSTADTIGNSCGFNGARLTTSNACAASSSAFAIGRALLRDGLADMVIVGGFEILDGMTIAGFLSLESLSVRPCSPYVGSEGLSLGEGGAMFVLERASDAWARQARVVGYLVGAGGSGDAFHPTAPEPSGKFAALAIRRALDDARLSPKDVSYVNGHGTGTQANDQMELRALRMVFDQLSPVLTSTKSQWGHPLLSSGALEASACLLGMSYHMVPPLLGAKGLQKGERPVRGPILGSPVGESTLTDISLSNSFGFGGTNSCLILASERSVSRSDHSSCGQASRREVYATLGYAGFQGQSCFGNTEGGNVVPDSGERPTGVSARLWRRLEATGRCSVVAASQVLGERGSRECCAVILASELGAITAGEAYEASVNAGIPRPNLFAHCSPNSIAGHVGAAFGLHGPTLSLGGGPTAAISALYYGTYLIRAGVVPEALVVFAEDPTADATGHIQAMYGDKSSRNGGAIAAWLTANPSNDYSIRIVGFGLGSSVGRVANRQEWTVILKACMADAQHPNGGYIASVPPTSEESKAVESLGLDLIDVTQFVVHRGALSPFSALLVATRRHGVAGHQILSAVSVGGTLGTVQISLP